MSRTDADGHDPSDPRRTVSAEEINRLLVPDITDEQAEEAIRSLAFCGDAAALGAVTLYLFNRVRRLERWAGGFGGGE